jgi:hypothetical protein
MLGEAGWLAGWLGWGAVGRDVEGAMRAVCGVGGARGGLIAIVRGLRLAW